MEKKKKSFQLPNWIRFTVSNLERLNTRWAFVLARHFFFRPIRFPRPSYEENVFNSSEKSKFIDIQGRAIQLFSWGRGPTVILSHGWSGRGTQMGKIAIALANSGFRAVAYDAPAHGLSAGSKSNLQEIVETIELLSKEFPDVHAYVGHSLGGLASLHAATRIPQVKRVVMIGSPNRITEIIENFCRMIRASYKIGDLLNETIEKQFGLPSDHYSSAHVLESLPNLLGLIVHDEEDYDVTIENAREIERAWRGRAQLVETKGLGHRRILSDEKVIHRVVNFVKEQNTDVASTFSD